MTNPTTPLHPVATTQAGEPNWEIAFERHCSEQGKIFGMPGLSARPCFKAGYDYAIEMQASHSAAADAVAWKAQVYEWMCEYDVELKDHARLALLAMYMESHPTAPAATTPAASESGIDTPEFLNLIENFHHQSSCENYDDAAYKAARSALVSYINAHTAAQVAASKPADYDDDAYLIDRLGKLLAGVAIAFKGLEPAGKRWSYHDLPDIAAKAMIELELFRACKSAAASGKAQDTYWLVESTNGCGWWDGRFLSRGIDPRFFTHDPNEAVRFARKADADRVCDQSSSIKATEHIWLATPQHQVQAGGEYTTVQDEHGHWDWKRITPSPESAAKPASKYTAEFEEAWTLYPSRPGMSKAAAFKAWTARMKAGATALEMIEGTRKYAAYCKAERTEAHFIKQPATFYGPGEHFSADWTVRRASAQSLADQQLANSEAAMRKLRGDDDEGMVLDAS